MKKEKKNLFFFHPKKIPVSRFNNMEPAANFFPPSLIYLILAMESMHLVYSSFYVILYYQ
jgi:hypothetical protein